MDCDDTVTVTKYTPAAAAGNSYDLESGSDAEDWGAWKSNSPKMQRAKVVASPPKTKSVPSATVTAPPPVVPTTFEKSKYNVTPYILRNKDQNMYPIRRNFYAEHPNIAKLGANDVESFLKSKNNIMIQELRTYPVKYDVKEDEDDDHFDENKVQLLAAIAGIPKAVSTFQEAFWQYPDILKIVENLKFTEPSPIQCIGWPTLLGGRDFIGIAQTGTGKTLTFVLPALVHIEGQTKERKFRRGPTALVLSPTRELAMQIESEVLKIKYNGIKSVCCYGGSDKGSQIAGLRDNPEIIVGTPGRLIDLMEMGYLCLKDVSYLVLDEADRMLDMGFELQVVTIINATRKQRQSVMTSATWPESVRLIALMYMDNPVQVNVGSLDLVACKDVLQELRQVENVKKTDVLCDIISSLNEHDKVIVFVTRKKQCRSLTSMLDRMIRSDQLGPHANVCEIHGDLDQDAREQSLSWFRDSHCNILVATNVASRGLDISDVTYVINYDFPKDIEEYVHRVGRTGRAGRQGRAITFMNDMDWKHATELRNILNQSKQVVPPWLMHLRAMKPSNISHYDDSRSFQVPDKFHVSNMKSRFSFDYDYDDDFDYNDDSCDFFDDFQSKLDPLFQAQEKMETVPSKGNKTAAVRETVVKYHSDCLDELCEDMNDEDNEDFFDEFQKRVDPVYRDVKEAVTGAVEEEGDQYESWW